MMVIEKLRNNDNEDTSKIEFGGFNLKDTKESFLKTLDLTNQEMEEYIAYALQDL